MDDPSIQVPEVYGAPPASFEVVVERRIALPNAVFELHQYQFRQPQSAIFRSPRGFLDLALSSRPGVATGGYLDGPDSKQRPLGDILFVPADHALQTEWGAGAQRSICCGFDDALPEDDDDPVDLSAVEACLDVRSTFVRDAMMRLLRELQAPGFSSALLVSAIWTETSVELSRYLRRSREAPRQSASQFSTTQLRLISDRIAEPGALPVVQELARACGCSTRHFFRMFRASTGMTLSDYAGEMRIDRAKTLLSGQQPAVKEVAWQCGFETAAAFSAAFRRAVGMTPKEYRHTRMN
jgi:AraC family transcriptional regulator